MVFNFSEQKGQKEQYFFKGLFYVKKHPLHFVQQEPKGTEKSLADNGAHVSTDQNPADDLTRGLKASELKKVHRNLIGHEFLQKGESDLTQQL